MNSINLNMKSVEVKTETRVIKYEWNLEMVSETFPEYDGFNDYFDRVLAKEFRRELRKKSINKIFQN